MDLGLSGTGVISRSREVSFRSIVELEGGHQSGEAACRQRQWSVWTCQIVPRTCHRPRWTGRCVFVGGRSIGINDDETGTARDTRDQ